MKKCFVVIAIGEKFQEQEAKWGASRRKYSERHGYDYVVLTELPEPMLTFEGRFTPRRSALLSKLAAPGILEGYDFAVYADGDTAFNSKAPCLSLIADRIPVGGFAAAQTLLHEDRRRYFPRWTHDYYTSVEHRGLTMPAVDRHLYVNSGLLAYRPKEVRERWLDLIRLECDANDENRLNAMEVQSGRCYVLAPTWNVLWYYEKFRMGYLRPATTPFQVLRNRVKNKLGIGERKLLLEAFSNSHMMHFAFEGRKLEWVASAF